MQLDPPARKHRVALSQRLKLIGRGFRSMLRRYPADLTGAMRAQRSHAPGAEAVQAHWGRACAADGARAVCWLGHASVLLRLGGLTIVTDPVLSSVIGMPVGKRVVLGPRRLIPLVVGPGEVPRPDLVLISHAHYDHLDRPTLRVLATRHTEVITAENTRNLIPRGFKHVHELRWTRCFDFHAVRVTAVKPRHWGARKGWDRHRGYNGYILEVGAHAPGAGVAPGAPITRILYAGDTADTHNFDGLGPFDVGIFGIGAYEPWHHAHATPEQVWRMAQAAHCARLLPVHHSTFKLSDEPMDEPLQRLLAAAGKERERVLALPPGEVAAF